MKRKMTRRIIVGVLTIILIVTGILPYMTNKAQAAENELYDKIILVTDNQISETAKEGYNKITFVIDNDTKDIYVKSGNTITLKSSDKNYGVLVGGINNGDAVTKDTIIYAKAYSYEGTLAIEKSIENEVPDENGYYTLHFSAKSQNLPSIKSENQNVILVLDRSLSMACSVDEGADAKAMAPSYEKTRWSVTVKAVQNFLNEFLPEGTSNKVSVVSYCESARIEITESSSKSEIMTKLNSIYNENYYNQDYNDKQNGYQKRKNVGFINRGLGGSTNIQQGIDKVSDVVSDKTGVSVIIFTDGVANKYDDTQIGGPYYIKNDNQNTEYTGSKKELNGSYYAGEAGKKLKEAGADIYTIVLMSKESDITNLVKVSLGNKSLSYETEKGDTCFTFSDGGYAKEFYTAASAEQLNSRFKQIMTEMTGLPFESSSVTDSLDEHFELVPDQENVVVNKDGTFTIKYPEKISATEQVVSVKIKVKDGYTGYSYTNDGCQFEGTIGGLTYTQKFKETPAAVILPDAADDEYTVNQDEVLDAGTVLVNDNNEIVNNPQKKLSLKTVLEENVKNGTIKFNKDGTFQYIPDKGFTGKDTFVYKVVLTVDGEEYTKSATVTINVNPKQPETPTEEHTPTEMETPTEAETPSQIQAPSENVTPSELQTPDQTKAPEIAANEDKVVAKTSVKTGDRSNTMYYIMLLLSVATTMTTTVVVYKKKKE